MLTFAQFVTQWEPAVAAVTGRLTRKARYHHLKNHLLPKFGNMPLTDIRQRVVQNYIGELSQTLSPATVSNIWRTLSTILHDAKREELITAVPEPKLPRSDSEQFFFTLPELKAILGAVTDPVDTAFYFCFAECGLRISEALALRWEDVDFRERVLFVRRRLKTKNARRELCFSPQLAQRLQAVRTVSVGPVFSFSESYARLRLSTLLRKLALLGSFHAFRHGNETLMEQLGVEEAIRRRRLGHSPRNITGRYGHHIWKEDERFANAIGKALTSGEMYMTSDDVYTCTRCGLQVYSVFTACPNCGCKEATHSHETFNTLPDEERLHRLREVTKGYKEAV